MKFREHEDEERTVGNQDPGGDIVGNGVANERLAAQRRRDESAAICRNALSGNSQAFVQSTIQPNGE